jgi:sarcosine oxidase delta subunit
MAQNFNTQRIEEIECPFCKEMTIKVFHKEETFSAQRTRCRSGKSTAYIRSPEKYEILVDKCPSCGKSKKEIERALIEGIPLSNKEIIRRMTEAGLDPRKLK